MVTSLLCASPVLTVLALPEAASQRSETEVLVDELVRDSQKHKIKRKEDPADPVWNAELAAAGLAGDLTAYNEQMLKIIRLYAQRGDFTEALYVAERLPGNGTVRAQAELALSATRAGETAVADQCVKLASEQAARLSGLPAEQVRSLRAQVLHLRGRGQEATAMQEKLGELELLLLESRLHEDGRLPALTLEQAQARLATIQSRGVAERMALFLLACARQQFLKGSIEAGRAFLPAIGKLATDEGLPHAQHVLVELARAAWMAGETKEAHKALNVFFRCCERYADGAEWKAPYLADAVALLIDWKEIDEAQAWLKVAEACLPKVFVMDAPQAILAVAKQRERLDGAAEGDRLAIQALRAGKAHPHPRVHATAAVLVWLHYAELQRPVPATVQQLLSITLKEEER